MPVLLSLGRQTVNNVVLASRELHVELLARHGAPGAPVRNFFDGPAAAVPTRSVPSSYIIILRNDYHVLAVSPKRMKLTSRISGITYICKE